MKSKERNSFYARIKRVQLDRLLLMIGERTRKMFVNNNPVEKLNFTLKSGILQKTGKLDLMAWSLSDVAYYAIKEGCDFGFFIPEERDFIEIYNEYLHFDNKVAKSEMEDIPQEEWLLKFSIGFSQKQFWYQSMGLLISEFNRQVELLEVIPGLCSSSFDIDSSCRSSIDFDIKTFRKILFAIVTIARSKVDISSFKYDRGIVNSYPYMTIENIRKVIDYYAADYSEYRNSILKENYFFIKPIVRTSRGKLLAINQYMLARKLVDGPFWVIRDYCASKNSQSFTREFGIYFEKYIERLFWHYLADDKYKKIVESNKNKKADWIIETTKYRFFVEQKSSLSVLMIKRPYPDINLINKHLDILSEGVEQLDSTEKNMIFQDNKIAVKILLHYETIYFSDGVIRNAVVERVKDRLNNCERIFFCNINDFEWFVKICGKDSVLADLIINKKIEYEKDGFKQGTEFGVVIGECTDIKNDYAEEVINHWEDYLEN